MITKNKRTKYRKIPEIEKLVDEIILNNEAKLKKINSNLINSEKFLSLYTKNKIIFYFKKHKNIINDASKKFSFEIISRARKNLGEKPVGRKFYEKTPEIQLKQRIKSHKHKIKFSIGKKNKVIENQDVKDIIHKKNTFLKPEKFKKTKTEIKQTLFTNINNFKVNDSKLSNKKVKNKTEEKTIKPELFKIEEKNTLHFLKKPDLFSKNILKQYKNNNKYSSDALNKASYAFSNDLNNNLNFIDQKPKLNKKDFNNNYKKETEKSKIIKKKKLFFKKTYSRITPEDINDKSFDINVKPFFKDGNISDLKDDEKVIIDEGIKKASNNIIESNDNKKVEEKVNKFFEEHLKDIDKKITEKPSFKPKKNKEMNYEESAYSQQEHVFFDEQEQESDFSGWSPNIIKREREELRDISGEINDKFIGDFNDIELPREALSTKSVKLTDLGFSEEEWEELDFYPLVDPYSYVEILKEQETLEKYYFLVEAELSDEEQQTMNFIYDTICNMTIDTEEFEEKGERAYLIENINKVIVDYNLKVDKKLLDKIIYNFSKSSLGFSKIDPLMQDPNIEDISCDGNNLPIFVYHRKYGSLKTNIQFDTGDELNSFVNRMAQKCGKHISIAEPMLDATMPDGSRIQMTLSDEITTHGSTFTIRKFRADPFSPTDLVELNTMSSEMIAYMWFAVENRVNMLFSGGTASGKTTCLNALSLFIPAEAKIVSIEETREITLPHPNWIPGVSRSGFGQVVADKVVGEIDTYDLMKAALRQRPEYILVGEIRGREAYVLFQAMATGHATYSTVHADSANSLIHRLEGKPIEIPRVMLQALDVVSIHITTSVKGKRARRCKQIVEIIDIDPATKEILTNEAFRWDPIEDKFIYTGKSYILERIRGEKDMSREDMTLEIKRRKKIIELMSRGNIRKFTDVARLVSHYSENPDQTLNELKKVVKVEE